MMSFFPFMRPYGFVFPDGEGRQANRALEWYLSILDILYGVMLLYPGDSLSHTIYEHLLTVFQEEVWGSLFVVKGLSHAAALYINGRRWWTPWIRAGSCTVSAVFWSTLLGILLSNPVFRPDFIVAIALLNSITYALAVKSCGYDAGLYWERHRHGRIH